MSLSSIALRPAQEGTISIFRSINLLLVERNLDVVYMVSEHCIVMEKGTIIAHHSPEEPAEPELARRHLAI